jgi:hypothetical protein
VNWPRFWRALFGVGLAAEVIALRTNNPEAPLSPTARRDLRTHHPLGRMALIAFCVWLVQHLCREVATSSGETIGS